MKHVYEDKKQNPEGKWRYLCSCGFVAQNEGSLIIHIANNNDKLILNPELGSKAAKGGKD